MGLERLHEVTERFNPMRDTLPPGTTLVGIVENYVSKALGEANMQSILKSVSLADFMDLSTEELEQRCAGMQIDLEALETIKAIQQVACLPPFAVGLRKKR